MLAMAVNDDAGILTPRGVLRFFREQAASGHPLLQGMSPPRFQGRNRQYAPPGSTSKKTKQ